MLVHPLHRCLIKGSSLLVRLSQNTGVSPLAEFDHPATFLVLSHGTEYPLTLSFCKIKLDC
ncbi:hypothetical protein BDW02DRAFT_132103 [Decorospora gaudefroyi]|uniref:Uncharacterized protein n=1 Tax=Decorospora gaudefroyi TaxID=184978 RepID=A0A6A5KV75_9PLEO|nr:hypothetical protein BDW02DRAFT_132103 [Decorospora gaudefroyi]